MLYIFFGCMSYCSTFLLTTSKYCLKVLTDSALCLETSMVLSCLASSSVLHRFMKFEVQLLPGCFLAIWPPIFATIHGVGGKPLSHSLLICLMTVHSCLIVVNCFCRAAWCFDPLRRWSFLHGVLLFNVTLNFLATFWDTRNIPRYSGIWLLHRSGAYLLRYVEIKTARRVKNWVVCEQSRKSFYVMLEKLHVPRIILG